MPSLKRIINHYECLWVGFRMVVRRQRNLLFYDVTVYGDIRFSMSGCLTLLRTPIFVPHCLSVTIFMSVRSDGHMMSVLERLRELAFHRWCSSWCLLLQVAWDPLRDPLLQGSPATTVFKKLASLLSEERSISRCLYWLRCRLCYSLLRSSVMCLRGHPSTHHGPTTSHIEVAYSEAWVRRPRLNVGLPAVQHFAI